MRQAHNLVGTSTVTLVMTVMVMMVMMVMMVTVMMMTMVVVRRRRVKVTMMKALRTQQLATGKTGTKKTWRCMSVSVINCIHDVKSGVK